jgi:hypothetical protein
MDFGLSRFPLPKVTEEGYGRLGGGTTHYLQFLREFRSEFGLGLINQQ